MLNPESEENLEPRSVWEETGYVPQDKKTDKRIIGILHPDEKDATEEGFVTPQDIALARIAELRKLLDGSPKDPNSNS